MKREFVVIVCLLVFWTASCVPLRYDGPYKGKIIDEETGNPIEGVVVLGVWYKEVPSPGGTVGSYYDAQETVSDKNGDFEIKGLGLKVFSFAGMMNVLVFKAGYSYVGLGMWASLKVDGGLTNKKVAWEGERAIIPLRIVAMDQRKKDALYPPIPPTAAPIGKVQKTLKEINRDLIMHGFEPMKVWNGDNI